jgi:hypothetical protein
MRARVRSSDYHQYVIAIHGKQHTTIKSNCEERHEAADRNVSVLSIRSQAVRWPVGEKK